MPILHIDFETRSRVPLKKHGLDRYIQDPSTEALMVAYALDEDNTELWQPRMALMPEKLRAALLDSSVTKMAWNYNFERDILRYKFDINIPQNQWLDPSVLSAYMSLPIGLDRAGKALNIEMKKDSSGKKYIKMFSEVSKATKRMLKEGSPETYFKDWSTHPNEWGEFCSYCKRDVDSEREVYKKLLDLNCPITSEENNAWQLDQRMNERGVYIDEAYVQNAKKLAEAEANELLSEIKAITGLENANSRDQLLGWLQERGFPYDSLDKEHVAEALKYKSTLKPLVVDILELKQKLGGSAYKKLESILDRMGIDKRLRDQFVYHGAHTGRWAGRGVQLQNLFKPDPKVTSYDWGKAVKDSEKRRLDIYTRAIRLGKKLYTPFTPMNLVASTIRGAFIATPGFKLDVGDLAQIESRVLACLARCHSMMDAYANGRDLYKECMSTQLHIPMDEVTSSMRDKGKIQILGCFEENTLVLTDSGWKRIIDIGADDLVFDGLNFVSHDGVIAQGKKEVIPVCGIGVTPDHRFLSKGWVEACQLQKNIQLEKQALNLGIGSFLSIDSTRFPLGTCVYAKGATNDSLLTKLTWKKDELDHAYPVLTEGFGRIKTEFTLDGRTSREKSSTGWLTDTTPSFLELDRPFEVMDGRDTQGEESRTNSIASMTSSVTSRPSTDMNLIAWRLTESTMMDIMNGEISGSVLGEKISKIEVPTFDILNAGSNNRFMILTTSGPMIVHNCGFGMGWEKFIEHAAKSNIILTEKDSKECVYGFRETYPEIPALWKEFNTAVIKAVKSNICVYVKGCIVDGRNPKVLKIKLPSGRCLHYFDPYVNESMKFGRPMEQISYTQYDSKGKKVSDLYGGLIVENVVQAIARDILLSGMLEAEKIGFFVISTIHDEIICESPIDSNLNLDKLLHCMTILPGWAKDFGFVLKAEGYEGFFYKK